MSDAHERRAPHPAPWSFRLRRALARTPRWSRDAWELTVSTCSARAPSRPLVSRPTPTALSSPWRARASRSRPSICSRTRPRAGTTQVPSTSAGAAPKVLDRRRHEKLALLDGVGAADRVPLHDFGFGHREFRNRTRIEPTPPAGPSSVRARLQPPAGSAPRPLSRRLPTRLENVGRTAPGRAIQLSARLSFSG